VLELLQDVAYPTSRLLSNLAKMPRARRFFSPGGMAFGGEVMIKEKGARQD